jgi:ABC-type uncharacterized transport system substrate-binding protein
VGANPTRQTLQPETTGAAAFDTVARERPDALFVTTTTFLSVRVVQLAVLAAFHRLPSSHDLREFAEAGGLMSYGTSIADVYRQNGVYAGRILKGANPRTCRSCSRRSSSWSSTPTPPGCLASRYLPCCSPVPMR